MRPKIAIPLILAAVLIATVYAAVTQDFSGIIQRFRNSSQIRFDSTSSIKDEDASWTLSASQMGKLAVMQSGRVTNVNSFSSTNTFSPAFSAIPVVVIAGGTNDAPHLISVSKTNVIFGAAATNSIIRWIAFGTP